MIPFKGTPAETNYLDYNNGQGNYKLITDDKSRKNIADSHIKGDINNLLSCVK